MEVIIGIDVEDVSIAELCNLAVGYMYTDGDILLMGGLTGYDFFTSTLADTINEVHHSVDLDVLDDIGPRWVEVIETLARELDGVLQHLIGSGQVNPYSTHRVSKITYNPVGTITISLGDTDEL